MQVNLRFRSINETCHGLLTGKHEENLSVILKILNEKIAYIAIEQ